MAGLDADTIFRLELACDEAATNIIEHAYGAEGVGNIIVQYEVATDAFTITMRDTGRPFDPDEIPPPPSFDNMASSDVADELDDQLKVGGLGVYFIRRLMDKVSYSFDQLHGNTLVMVKRLSTQESA